MKKWNTHGISPADISRNWWSVEIVNQEWMLMTNQGWWLTQDFFLVYRPVISTNGTNHKFSHRIYKLKWTWTINPYAYDVAGWLLGPSAQVTWLHALVSAPVPCHHHMRSMKKFIPQWIFHQLQLFYVADARNAFVIIYTLICYCWSCLTFVMQYMF